MCGTATAAYQRGQAQGLLLYPRPALDRGLADILLISLHMEFGRPEGADQADAFMAGYADGQRMMEAIVEQQQDSAQAAPAGDVRVVADYVSRLERMVQQSNASRPRWIRTADELPRYGLVVQLCDSTGRVHAGYLHERLRRKQIEYCYRLMTSSVAPITVDADRIVAWQPLAAPVGDLAPAPAEVTHG